MPAKWQRWMPFEIDAFRGSPSVQAMHPAARAGYLYLLADSWQTDDCAISNDAIELADRSGLGDELWAIHGPRILRKFETVEGTNKIRNAALFTRWLEAKAVYDAGQKERDEISEKRREAGKKGADKRWQNGKPIAKDGKNAADTGEQGGTPDTGWQNADLPHPPIANASQTGPSAILESGKPIANDGYTETHTGTETKEELTLLSPLAPPLPKIRPEEFANTWNKRRGELPRVEKFSDPRRKKVQTRMNEGLTLDRFIEAIENCRTKPFLRGVNDSGWTATFDWLIDNAVNVEKAINNPYGLNATGGKANGKPSSTDDRAARINARIAQPG
ncbi:MAG TPA: hypothetical protein VGR71_10605 [Nitrospira sp.]|nr:hypothetical protein [Nitrospira sp.]